MVVTGVASPVLVVNVAYGDAHRPLITVVPMDRPDYRRQADLSFLISTDTSQTHQSELRKALIALRPAEAVSWCLYQPSPEFRARTQHAVAGR